MKLWLVCLSLSRSNDEDDACKNLLYEFSGLLYSYITSISSAIGTVVDDNQYLTLEQLIDDMNNFINIEAYTYYAYNIIDSLKVKNNGRMNNESLNQLTNNGRWIIEEELPMETTTCVITLTIMGKS